MWQVTGDKKCRTGGVGKLFMSRVTSHVFRRVFIFPCNEKNECDTGTNGTVSNIEGWKTDFAPAALLQIEIDEVHDSVAAGKQTVD